MTPIWIRTQLAWLSNVSFEFNNASGGIVSMTPSQVVDTTVARVILPIRK